MGKSLVAYISKTGSTAEISGRISSVLASRGISNDVKPFDEILSSDDYSSFIIGAPINGMKILPEFHRFINSRNIPREKIAGIFIVSYIYNTGRPFWKNRIYSEYYKIKKKYRPFEITVFNGRLRDKMPGFAGFLFGIKPETPLDNIDWENIEKWANKLADNIRLQSQ